MNGIPVKSIFQRVLTRTDRIDFLYKSIPEDLRSKRAIRDSWYKWNSLWQKAWMSSEIDEEEKLKLRESCSVSRREI